MIEVKMINNTSLVLNSDLIEFIEATPDTLIALTNGKKMIVQESVEEVVDRIVAFRRRIGIVKDLVAPETANEPTDSE
jgi:flagellar protein FlbD